MTRKAFDHLAQAMAYYGLKFSSAERLRDDYGLPWGLVSEDSSLSAMRREATLKKPSALLMASYAVYWREYALEGREEGRDKMDQLVRIYPALVDETAALNLRRFWDDVPSEAEEILHLAAHNQRAKLIRWVEQTLQGVVGEVPQIYLAARLLAPLYGKPDLKIKDIRPSKLVASLFNSMIHKGDLDGYASKRKAGDKTTNVYHDYRNEGL